MSESYTRDLGEGLRLRRARSADAEALAAFNADVFGDESHPYRSALVRQWVMDLATRPHPRFTVEDFLVVEDIRTDTLVSTLCVIPQIWTYAGIPLPVGQVEQVGTHRDYRRRGLVRELMAAAHRLSAELGHMAQVIDGIPNFYRQFGYEMALSLYGGRLHPAHELPLLDQGAEAPFRVRPAREEDVEFIAEVYARANERYLVSCVRDAEVWRLELSGRTRGSLLHVELAVVESAWGGRVGFFAYFPRLASEYGRMLYVTQYEVAPGTSLGAVSPYVLSYLHKVGNALLPPGEENTFWNVGLWLGAEHPAYDVLYGRFADYRPPYAWYVRVPDLRVLLLRIAPALEQRLAASPLAGHTGDLRLNFYRLGVNLRFAGGSLATVETWQPSTDDWGDVSFPDLTFLQLMLGYRSLDELRHAFADCYVWTKAAKPLLDILFPKQISNVWHVL